MKFGTIVELPDGRRGTVVYNGLDGVGIAWGELRFTSEQISVALGANPLFGRAPDDYPVPFAEALLRDSWDGAHMPCVGRKYKIVERPQ